MNSDLSLSEEFWRNKRFDEIAERHMQILNNYRRHYRSESEWNDTSDNNCDFTDLDLGIEDCLTVHTNSNDFGGFEHLS